MSSALHPYNRSIRRTEMISLFMCCVTWPFYTKKEDVLTLTAKCTTVGSVCLLDGIGFNKKENEHESNEQGPGSWTENEWEWKVCMSEKKRGLSKGQCKCNVHINTHKIHKLFFFIIVIIIIAANFEGSVFLFLFLEIKRKIRASIHNSSIRCVSIPFSLWPCSSLSTCSRYRK